MEDRNSVKYLYDVNGVKLRTEHILNGDTQITDYCGNAVYENGALKMLLNEAGYVSLPNEVFHFYLKDHLGNVRVVADEDGHTEEVNDYYPFGGTFSGSSSVQPYKYNGKELDRKNGLDWYDYGARHYDAAIGRWHVLDPLAEKHYSISPYVYCGNEPIGRIDPDGRDDYSVNQKGQIELIRKTEEERDKLIALGKNNKIEFNDDGNMVNSSFDVDKGVLDNQKKTGEITYMFVKGNKQAEGMFAFLSKNTGLEWGQLSYGESSNHLSTNNSTLGNGIETIAYDKFFTVGKGNLIKSIDHSHPDETPPSGFNAADGYVKKGGGDKAFAEWMYRYFPTIAPSVRLRVFYPNQKTYIYYNNKGILTK